MIRHAVGVQTGVDPSVVIQFDELTLQEINDFSKFHCGHELPKSFMLECKEMVSVGGSLKKVFETTNASGEKVLENICNMSNLRIIATHSGLHIDCNVPSSDGLFLLVERTNECPDRGWHPTSEPSVHSLIKIDRDFDDLRSLFEDIMVDIAIANSNPYIHVINKIIERDGREDFYRSKVKYALSFTDSDTAYGKISAETGYVAFSALTKNKHFIPHDRIKATISLWDEFLITKYPELLANNRSVAEYLKKWPLIGGQLPLEDTLVNEISSLETGAWLMIFVKRSRHAMIEISSQIGGNVYSNTLNGYYRFIRPYELNDAKKELLREGRFESIKFLLGDGDAR